jgi:hypothetical protein
MKALSDYVPQQTFSSIEKKPGQTEHLDPEKRKQTGINLPTC